MKVEEIAATIEAMSPADQLRFVAGLLDGIKAGTHSDFHVRTEPCLPFRTATGLQLHAILAQRDALRGLLEEIPALVPTNWLDPLLTGDKKVVHREDSNRDIENVLMAVRDRIQSKITETLADTEALASKDKETL